MIGHLYDKNIVIKWSSYIVLASVSVFFIADISVIGISVNLLIGAPLILNIVCPFASIDSGVWHVSRNNEYLLER